MIECASVNWLSFVYREYFGEEQNQFLCLQTVLSRLAKLMGVIANRFQGCAFELTAYLCSGIEASIKMPQMN